MSLQITFDGNHDRIVSAIKTNAVSGYFLNSELFNAIEVFKKNAPEPLNTLSSYLMYTTNAGIDWTGSEEDIMIKAYGILHMLSNFIDFYRYALTPEATRTTVNLANHVLLGYETSWEDLTGTLEDKVVLEKEVHITEIVTRQYVDGGVVSPSVVPTIAPMPVAPVAQVAPVTPVQEPVSAIADMFPTYPEPEVTPAPTVEPVPAQVPVQPTQQPVEPTKSVEPTQDTNNPNVVYVDPSSLDDLEAKIAARKKAREEKKKKAEQEEAKKKAEPKDDKKDVFGDSGALQMSEAEIAAESLAILEEFDI